MEHTFEIEGYVVRITTRKGGYSVTVDEASASAPEVASVERAQAPNMVQARLPLENVGRPAPPRQPHNHHHCTRCGHCFRQRSIQRGMACRTCELQSDDEAAGRLAFNRAVNNCCEV